MAAMVRYTGVRKWEGDIRLEGGSRVCRRKVVRGHHQRNHSTVDRAESRKSVGVGVV